MADRTYFLLHNQARAISSRTQRVNAPISHAANLWVLGHRVLPKRPVSIPIAEFEVNKDMLLTMVREGRIAVTAPDGTFIDSCADGTLIYFKEGKPVQVEDKIGKQSIELPKPVEPVKEAPVVETVVAPPKPAEPPKSESVVEAPDSGEDRRARRRRE